MIHPRGLFDYQVPLRRRADGAWYGQAMPHDDERWHPGLVGECPHLVLSAGSVTLTCTESLAQQQRRPVYTEGYPPTDQAVFEVGLAFEQVAADGALLRVTRTGTGDLGVLLLLDQQVALAVGDVDHHLRGVIDVHYDPRIDDDELYWVKYMLGRPDTHLVWLDADQIDVEATREYVLSLPNGDVQFAYRGQRGPETSRLNNQIMEYAIRLRRFSTTGWIDVDPRFTTREAWLAHVWALPDKRPDDLHVMFKVAGAAVTLREREYAFEAPWHIYLHRIRRVGVPGQHTVMAVAREHPRLDNGAVVRSTERIASRTIRMA